MKKVAKILVLVLTLVLSLTMVACSSYKKVEKALVDIGYAVIESDTTAENMKEESDVAVKMHILSNKDSIKFTETLKLNIVIVLEFKATDDMIEYYKDSDTMQGLVQDVKDDGSAKEFYDSLVEKGLAKGNCLVISTNPLAAETVMNAIKNA